MAPFLADGRYYITIKFVAISLLMSTCCNSSKILVYPDDTFNSKQFQYVAGLSEILVENGHEVTLLKNSKLTPNSKRSDTLLVKTYGAPQSISFQDTDDYLSYSGLMYQSSAMPSGYLERRVSLCDALLRRQYLLIQLQMEEFDVLLLDNSNVCGRALSDYLKIPVIVWTGYNFDFDCDFSYDCVSSNVWAEHEEIWDRLKAALRQAVHINFYKPYFIFNPIDDINNKLHINQGMLVSETFLRQKPLFIVNMESSVDMPKPALPFAIQIAGIWKKEEIDLPIEIKEYFENAGQNGVVYIDVDFGSRWLLTKQILMLLKVLNNLGQNVIIQHQQKLAFNLSSGLKFIPKSLHKIILGQKQTKLFITTCEFDTMHEVAHYGVPVIILSLFGNDAAYCQNIITKHKIGKLINILQLGYMDIKHEAKVIIDNDIYLQNSKRLAKTFNKQINGSRERFLHWVDYVIDNKGAENLYSSSTMQMRWYQYFMVDLVVLSLVFILVICPILLYIFLRLLVMVWSRRKKQKQL
ncbi:UDP-glucuronosyltransferase 2B17-like [Rhopilema esculentum]|uniref:UDP-glucuronosyltransferase 2B17-like n=1 Tax=Rhopilema esculentum TaxID=499914 RepID=UPI0031D08785|eukprot:gene6277-11697_t